jgi:WD40 repeat protein
MEHTDDIISLTVNRHSKYPNIVASGQIGKKASINIWDASTLETQSILQGTHTIGVCSLGFSANGRLLVSVGVDENHT